MKLFYTLTLSALAVSLNASAQSFECSPQRMAAPVQKEATELTWIQYCTPDVKQVQGVGTGSSEILLTAATQFKKETLADYAGKKIYAAAFYIYSPLATSKAFILKGDNINASEKVAEVEVNALNTGWNYVKFPEPVEIDGDVALAVGYSAYDNTNYPIGYDGKKVVSGTSYLKLPGEQFKTQQASWGNLMIRALVEGDPDQIGCVADVYDFDIPRFIPQNTDVVAPAYFSNSGVVAVDNFTYSITVDGQTVEKTVNETIAANSNCTVDINIGKVQNDGEITLKLIKVNGEEVSGSTITKKVSLYDPETVVPRNILLEKYTGQTCGNCPAAEEVIKKAIAGNEDRVVRIDHHYGYQNDKFTITESERIGRFFGANYAPGCVMDRDIQEDRTGMGQNAEGIYWHPGYMTKSIVTNAISRPAFVSVNIDREYDEATKELTVTVSGKAYMNMDGARLTVALTHSKVKASQAGASSGWLHNEFPVKYLTAYNGDPIEFDEEGKYEQTFTYTIEDTYCKAFVKTDVETMEIVAHLGEWNTKNNSQVLNAAKKKVTAEDESGLNNILVSKASIAYANGQFTVNGNAADVEVYTLSGMRVNNTNLSAGMYIVRAKVNNKTLARKMVVK